MKRKWRWGSKSLFGSKAPHKTTPTDRLEREASVEQRLSGISFDSSVDDGQTKAPVAARKRRSGSKILSLIGLQKTSSKYNPAYANLADSMRDTSRLELASTNPNEQDIALAIAKDAAVPSASSYSRAKTFDGLAPLKAARTSKDNQSYLPAEESASLVIFIGSDAVHPALAKASQETHRPEPVPIMPYSERESPVGVRQCMPSTSFAHQLSHKLSTTFGNPTIVHRPSLHVRPSLVSMQDGLMSSGTRVDVEGGPRHSPGQGSTAPSSLTYSGSVSAGGCSTGKTSLESNIIPVQSANAREGVETAGEEAATLEEVHREKSLSPIQEAPPPVIPTFVTVETTVNAKVFFETHFNALLAGHATPRSIRRRDLEHRLEALSMTQEQRRLERWAWANHESDHLRQSRVLKSKTNDGRSESGVAIAGYEVVRVLGKGSFGVVRLVREKETPRSAVFLTSSRPNSNLSRDQNQKQSTRGDLSNLGASAIGALRSTLDGYNSQRRCSNDPRKEVYAMKVIRKSEMLRNCQEGHLRAERDFLVASEKSKWVIPLVASFQDSTNLYLVMDYMIGGDFLGLLFRKNVLKEKHARWYVAEMILCVEETHRCRWIHRDIKPDNFLISASGHLKISDFGLAFDGHWAHDTRYFKNHRRSLMEKLGIEAKGDSEDQEEDAKRKVKSNLANVLTGRADSRETAQVDGPHDQESILQWRNRHGKRKMAVSVVGTSQYMAPEVIRGDHYDGRCDWWSIGIILYEVSHTSISKLMVINVELECLYGFTPFVCENREETKNRILVRFGLLLGQSEDQN